MRQGSDNFAGRARICFERSLNAIYQRGMSIVLSKARLTNVFCLGNHVAREGTSNCSSLCGLHLAFDFRRGWQLATI